MSAVPFLKINGEQEIAEHRRRYLRILRARIRERTKIRVSKIRTLVHPGTVVDELMYVIPLLHPRRGAILE